MKTQKKKGAFLSLLLWIFFLPFMAAIAIIKSPKINKKIKGILLAVLGLLVIIFAAAGDTPETPSNGVAPGTENVSPNTDRSGDKNIAGPDKNISAPSGDQNSSNTSGDQNNSNPSGDKNTSDLDKDSTFRVHFIDVGQADATLIECDDHYMLIDGGNKDDSSVIYSVLKNAGVSKLDIVVATHAHEDHVGGLPGAYNYCSADLTLCPVKSYDSNAFEDFAKYADQKGGGITVPSIGNNYSLGSAAVKILGVNGGSDTNDTSIVLRIDYGETSFLFTGDAERDAEQTILNSGSDLSATVLKVGHHGSDTSTTYPFLREIMPQYAVISVGTGNSYGHPTEETLSRLRDADVTVFRTDLQGDVYCTSDGKTVTFSVAKNANADVFNGIGQNSTQTDPTPNPTPTPDPTPTPGPTPTPDPAPAVPENQETFVWIPNSGSKYHFHSACSNMKNPSQVTKETAEARGYTPCSKCW